MAINTSNNKVRIISTTVSGLTTNSKFSDIKSPALVVNTSEGGIFYADGAGGTSLKQLAALPNHSHSDYATKSWVGENYLSKSGGIVSGSLDINTPEDPTMRYFRMWYYSAGRKNRGMLRVNENNFELSYYCPTDYVNHELTVGRNGFKYDTNDILHSGNYSDYALSINGGTVNGLVQAPFFSASEWMSARFFTSDIFPMSVNTTGMCRWGTFDEVGGLKIQFGADSNTKIEVVNREWNASLFRIDTSGKVWAADTITSPSFIGHLTGTADNANSLGGEDYRSFARYTAGNGSIGFYIPNTSIQYLGQGDGFIEYYDSGWYNAKWGKVTAVNGFFGNLTGNAATATSAAKGESLAGGHGVSNAANYSITYLAGGFTNNSTATANQVYLGTSSNWDVISSPNHDGTNAVQNIMSLRLGWNKSYWHEIATGPNANNKLYHRSVNAGTPRSWALFLDSLNYTDYCASTGHTHSSINDSASGAATTFAYSKTGLNYDDYTWLAGWNGYELRAVAKSQFAKASHTHTINKLTIKGIDAATTHGDYMGILQNAAIDGMPSGTWFNVIKILHNNSAGYYTELAQSFTGTEGLYHRRMNNGVKSDWRLVLDSVNYTSYCASVGHTHSYLPLAGGTLTGPLIVSHINNTAGNTLISQSSGNSTYVGNSTVKTVLFADKGLLADIGGTRYNIYHSGNSHTHAIEDLPIHTFSSTAQSLGWTSTIGTTKIPTINTIAYWNGAHGGTSSNLQYCDRGRFGTIVTKNTDDYATAGHSHSGLVGDIITFTKSLNVTTSWQDTGISGADLSTGTYIIQLVADLSGTASLWSEIFSGIMTWYQGSTNSTDVDEIFLHKAGHASNGQSLFLRTIRRAGSSTLKLQIACTTNFGATKNLTFKFRKMI